MIPGRDSRSLAVKAGPECCSGHPVGRRHFDNLLPARVIHLIIIRTSTLPTEQRQVTCEKLNALKYRLGAST